MRIAFFVGVLMMHAMRGDPGNRSAFQGQAAASSKEILHPLWRLVPAMGQQAMVAHADAQAAANPPHNETYDKGLPGEEKHGGKRAQVQTHHDQGDAPINWLLKSSILFEEI